MTLKIALAQTNFLVGDIAANVQNINQNAWHAQNSLGADLVVFPELTVTGYPAEDLLLRQDFITAANDTLDQLAALLPERIAVVIGFPERDGGRLYNSAAVLYQGKVLAVYRKRALPNYGVFDEQRYFTAGDKPCVFEFKDANIGLTIF